MPPCTSANERGRDEPTLTTQKASGLPARPNHQAMRLGSSSPRLLSGVATGLFSGAQPQGPACAAHHGPRRPRRPLRREPRDPRARRESTTDSSLRPSTLATAGVCGFSFALARVTARAPARWMGRDTWLRGWLRFQLHRIFLVSSGQTCRSMWSPTRCKFPKRWEESALTSVNLRLITRCAREPRLAAVERDQPAGRSDRIIPITGGPARRAGESLVSLANFQTMQIARAPSEALPAGGLAGDLAGGPHGCAQRSTHPRTESRRAMCPKRVALVPPMRNFGYADAVQPSCKKFRASATLCCHSPWIGWSKPSELGTHGV